MTAPRRARVVFDGVQLAIDFADTPTAEAIWAALPIEASAMTWGEEVYFDVPVEAETEPGARAVVTPGEIAYWPAGAAIAIGYGRTPISRGDETRLASPCNVFASCADDVRQLSKVAAGSTVRVERLET